MTVLIKILKTAIQKDYIDYVSTWRPCRATARTKTTATMTEMMWRGTMATARRSQHSNTGAWLSSITVANIF